MTTAEHSSAPKPRTTFGPAEPICWPQLGDDDAAEMLGEVNDWVSWLTQRFTLDHRTVPNCWDQHGPIIEELSALYTAWQCAYTLTDWVARTGCRPGEHR